MFTQYAPLEKRLKRAVTARGWSWQDCEISDRGPGTHRVTNARDGSWIDFDTAGWRIRIFCTSQEVAAIAAAEAEGR